MPSMVTECQRQIMFLFIAKVGACLVVSSDSEMGGRSSAIRRQFPEFRGEIRFAGPRQIRDDMDAR